MRALRIESYGSPADALALVEVEERSPGPGEVAVAIEAAPVNPSDLLLIRGRYGVRPSLPAAVGAEGIGSVVAVGDGVTSPRPGDRVLLVPTLEHGTWREQTVVPARNALPLPAGDGLQLAMVGINPITAYLLLHAMAEPEAGGWVAQTAANSAVGHYVIQLARHAGFRTLNVVRREEVVQPLLDAGADAVLVSGPDLARRAREALGDDRPGLLLDVVAGDTVLQMASVLADGATVVSYGGVGADPLPVSVPDLVFRDVSVRGFWLARWLRQTAWTEIEATYGHIAQLIADGVLAAPVDAAYPLERYREAVAHASRGLRQGKILFTPGG